MSLDPGSLFLSLITGAIGLALFVYGKKNDRWPHMAAGLLYMVYPYFTTGVTQLAIVGGIIAAGLWLLVRSGY